MMTIITIDDDDDIDNDNNDEDCDDLYHHLRGIQPKNQVCDQEKIRTAAMMIE